MAHIIPFRAGRFDPAVAGELGKLIAPPYDVISIPMRDALIHASEYNVARITRADREPTGTPYAQTARLWKSWHEQGVVRHDPTPAIYVYDQLFELSGRKFSRTGMITLARLEKLGDGILPHEHTFAAPRADRLELLRATKTQFGLVFALYPDPENRVDAILEQAKTAPPLLQTADRDNQLHRLWAITDPPVIARLQEIMHPKRLLIADGHHRYETALAFQNENPHWEPANYRMMVLVNTANVGLVVLPTHRLVKGLPNFDREDFFARLRKDFDIRPYPGHSRPVRAAVISAIRAQQERGKHAFGLILSGGKHYILILRSIRSMDNVPNRSEAWRKLDVAILHHLVLEGALHITPAQIEQEACVEYIQDFPQPIKQAADRIRSGDAQACFLLNPTRIEDVLDVAQNGERLPQKSTFFHPKVYSGLVFNCLEHQSLGEVT